MFDTEQKLLEGMRENSRSAFSAFYTLYAPPLLGFISGLIADRHLAAQVLEDAVVKIWREIDQFKADSGSFFTWMLTIVRPMALLAKDTQTGGHHPAQRPLVVNHGVDGLVNNPFVPTEPDQADAELQKTFDLFYLHGCPTEKIARELNTTPKTIRTRISLVLEQGRQLLRQKP